MRCGLVTAFVWIGALKFTDYEVERALLEHRFFPSKSPPAPSGHHAVLPSNACR
jgi:hypothetical protein